MHSPLPFGPHALRQSQFSPSQLPFFKKKNVIAQLLIIHFQNLVQKGSPRKFHIYTLIHSLLAKSFGCFFFFSKILLI